MNEALPDDAEMTRHTIGGNEVWETKRWQYLVRRGTREVLNVVERPAWPAL